MVSAKPSSKTQLLNNFLDSAKGMMDPRSSQNPDSQLNLSSKRAPMKQGLKMGGGVAAYGDQQTQIP